MIRAWSVVVAFVLLVAACAVVSPQGEIDALMKEGQALYSAQRFDEAIARFRSVAARDPGAYFAHLWIARSAIAKGAWPEAAIAAREAYKLNPGAPDVMPVLLEALLGGGNAALAQGLFIDSIGYFSEYLRHQPTNIRAWINVGRAYAANRQFLDAIKALRRAIELDPSDWSVWLDLGKAYWQQGSPGEALSAFGRVLQLNPRNAEALKFLQGR